jgi:hypothetical protein
MAGLAGCQVVAGLSPAARNVVGPGEMRRDDLCTSAGVGALGERVERAYGGGLSAALVDQYCHRWPHDAEDLGDRLAAISDRLQVSHLSIICSRRSAIRWETRWETRSRPIAGSQTQSATAVGRHRNGVRKVGYSGLKPGYDQHGLRLLRIFPA